MPKGKRISTKERHLIKKLSLDGKDATYISEIIGVGKSSVFRIIKESPNIAQKPRGRKHKYDRVFRRRAVVTAKKYRRYGTRRLSMEIGNGISHQSVWRILKSSNLRRKKPKPRPKLTRRHVEARQDFGIIFLANFQNVHKIVWTDEKRFSLDGPDAYNFIWWELDRNKEPELFKMDSYGKRGVMVHLAFSANRILSCQMIDGTLNGIKYVQLLQNSVIPKVVASHGHDFIFQQDNAPPHTAKITKEWLEKEKIELLDWPAYSPDLNPVENLWAIIARRVYTNGIAYTSEDALWNLISEEVENLEKSVISGIIGGMKNRIGKMLKRCGKYAQ